MSAIGLRASTRRDAPGLHLDVVEMRRDGSHDVFATIDYTPEQAVKIVRGMLLCMGKTMVVSE
ncbi:hypothetical protein CH296_00475 [Rhodococcus sp. 14-2496-1d]|uniref:hypothetical protein n=1 Tax=Rhodococcus sp. 14-2496-1d TaxID=2023146 RepID=UPI000B9BAEE0|nr:hypothetical protein [Rhodococcus sp. 14-2496-1d]OZF40765.1 hypothetical protein CH296_00475 [Rhodococcus sp. 14-2496-1d]